MECIAPRLFWLPKVPFRNQLTGFPLYITCDFSLLALSTLSLFYIRSALTAICYGALFFCLIYLVSCAFLVSVWVYLYLVWGCFLLWSCLYYWLGIFLLHYAYTLKVWSFHGVPHFLCVLFLYLIFSFFMIFFLARSSTFDCSYCL